MVNTVQNLPIEQVVDELLAGAPAGDAAAAALAERLTESARAATLDDRAIDGIAAAYRRLGAPSRTRHHLLRLLTASSRRAALTAFADLIAADPPGRAADAALAFVPLFHERRLAADALFPRLWDCLQCPATATLTLDLANHLTRRHAAVHPASSRAAQLAALLGELVNRLARLQERPEEFGRSHAALRTIVAESVGLVVALCDALALIGDSSVTGKLHQALQLAHRRVRAEAAFALARLGDEAGVETLARLAADPSARLRALTYLEDLALIDRASEADRSPAARAEGELASWLAEPTQFGLAPRAIELFDSRRQRWPGFDEPVECYLFRYEYAIGGRAHSNIAIAGPVLFAFGADLGDLPPSDIYAAYAGWCAEHDEIDETTAESLTPSQRLAWHSICRELTAAGYDEPNPVKLAHFFGETHWVATARRGDTAGVLVHDGRHVEWHPGGIGSHPPGPTEIYQIHKGRKLLKAFNT